MAPHNNESLRLAQLLDKVSQQVQDLVDLQDPCTQQIAELKLRSARAEEEIKRLEGELRDTRAAVSSGNASIAALTTHVAVLESKGTDSTAQSDKRVDRRTLMVATFIGGLFAILAVIVAYYLGRH